MTSSVKVVSHHALLLFIDILFSNMVLVHDPRARECSSSMNATTATNNKKKGKNTQRIGRLSSNRNTTSCRSRPCVRHRSSSASSYFQMREASSSISSGYDDRDDTASYSYAVSPNSEERWKEYEDDEIFNAVSIRQSSFSDECSVEVTIAPEKSSFDTTRSRSFSNNSSRKSSRSISNDAFAEKIARITERLARPTKSHLSYKSDLAAMRNKLREERNKKSIHPSRLTQARSNSALRSSQGLVSAKNQVSLYRNRYEGRDQDTLKPKTVGSSSKTKIDRHRTSYYHLLNSSRKLKKAVDIDRMKEELIFERGSYTNLRQVCGQSSKTTKQLNSNGYGAEKGGKSVHDRLYNYSKQYRSEGKQRRENIEEKLRAKYENRFPKKKISPKEACRLYYVGMESIRMRQEIALMYSHENVVS